MNRHEDMRSADASRLASLATALELAEAGGVEIDFAITGLVDRHRYSAIRDIQSKSQYACGFGHCNFWFDNGEGFSGNYPIHPFTTSVEAALSLVPQEWALDHLCEHYRVGGGAAHKLGGATCKLATDGNGQIRKVQAAGKTLALAICLAALKARENASASAPPSPARGTKP